MQRRWKVPIWFGAAVAVALCRGQVGGWGPQMAAQTVAAGQAARPGGQTPAQPGEPTAATGAQTLQVFSREALVDVTVTDAKGEPVHGLGESDFTILEDGKEQPIRSFHEYGKEPPPGVRTAPALPPNVYTNLQPAPASSAVNILLLDALNTAPADQMFIKEESTKFLKGMPAGTRVAVLGLSSSLRVLQGFTSDPAILMAAINTKRNRALPSPFIDGDTGDTIDSLMDIVDDGTAASLQEFQNEQAAFQADMRNRMTLEALDQIAAYVAAIKGRKNLIWFTAGMPLTIFPTQAAGVATGGTNDLQGLTDYSKDLRKTTDLLTAAEVAVYPVDARGLFNNPANSAVNGAKGLSGKSAAQKGAVDAAAQMAFMQKTGQELLSMEAVAEATGGVAYYNTNDLKTAVGKAIENGANYYAISYVPPSPQYDGRYHAINVKVDKPGLHLGFRRGYNADDIVNNRIAPGITLATTAPEPYGNNMAASMSRGVPTSTQLLFTVRVQVSTGVPKPTDPPVMGTLDPKLQGKALVRYDVEYSLPARQISFTKGADGVYTGSVDFDVAAFDVYGKRITGLSQTIKLPLKESQYQQLGRTPLRFFQQIDLPPGEMFVRVGVQDGTSDKVGTLEIPMTVKKKGAGQGLAPKASGGG